MDEVLLAVSVIGGLVFSFTTLIKSTITEKRWLPYINLAVGLIIGIGWAVSFGENRTVFLWAGIVAGLSAGGFYDAGKALTNGGKNNG